MSNIIITGANGQLGQFLIKYLLDNELNLEVIGTVRHKSYDCQKYIFDRSKVKFELMDLSDSHSIENLILKYKSNYFVNTSANAFVGESWKVPFQQFELNTLGVLHQLESIRKHSPHTRYINLGTSEEFGSDTNDGKSQDENTKIDPKSPYGCSKAAARYLINTYKRSYNLYALQLWAFNFESELRGEKYVTKKITKGVAKIYHAIKNNKKFEPIELGNLDSVRSWQFCGDVADGIWRMLNQEKYNNEIKFALNEFKKDLKNVEEIEYGRTDYEIEKLLSKYIKNYVISSSTHHTVREFVNIAFKEAKIKGFWRSHIFNEPFKGYEEYVLNIYDSKTHGPCGTTMGNEVLVKINKDFFRPHDVTYLNGDASIIKKDLGWSSTLTFEDLVKRMVKYDIENYNDKE